MRIHRRWAQAASAVALGAAVAWAALALPTAPAAQTGRGQSLPRFEGKTLGGGRAGTDLLAKRRGMVFAFASDDPDADRMAELIEKLRPQAQRANVAMLGVT